MAEARTKADEKKVEALDVAKERHMQALRLVGDRLQPEHRAPLGDRARARPGDAGKPLRTDVGRVRRPSAIAESPCHRN